MMKLLIQKHGRLQDEVAERLGIFRDHGLTYKLVDHRRGGQDIAHLSDCKNIAASNVGPASAYRDFILSTTNAHVSATSHWAVSLAAASEHGEIWKHAYSIMPSGIYAGPQARVQCAHDLINKRIVVGRHSGSHFALIHAFQRLAPGSEVKTLFVEGKTNRLKHMLTDPASVGLMFGTDAYVLEAKGYRKLVDTSFIVTFLISGSPESSAVRKYFDALHDAQKLIDEDPAAHKALLLRDLPAALSSSVEPHALGIGERMVFDGLSDDQLKRSERSARSLNIALDS